MQRNNKLKSQTKPVHKNYLLSSNQKSLAMEHNKQYIVKCYEHFSTMYITILTRIQDRNYWLYTKRVKKHFML